MASTNGPPDQEWSGCRRILTESLNSDAPKRSIFQDADQIRSCRCQFPAARLEPAQMEDSMAKALKDAKKETKKKPEKTLKEKRLEKAAKKASK